MSNKTIFIISLISALILANLAIFIKPPNITSDSLEPKNITFLPITLSSIFSDKKIPITIPANEKIVLIATGDVIPARVVNISETNRNNFIWPYEKIANVLKSADITLINLETPLVKNCPLANDGFKFCGSDRNIEGLLYAGIDIASLANNHAGNYGINGIDTTNLLLNKNGILTTGVNNAAYKNVKGIRFAFLGYNDIGAPEEGISWANIDKIKSEIIEAKKKSDVVVVEYHWGIEYVDHPNERQKYLAHEAIDSGADLVIGNHPHWIQPVEIYKGKVITYAHGNFIFDQEWSLKTKQGVVGKYTFYRKMLVDVEFLPVQIENYGQPYFLQGTQKRQILDEMAKQSFLLTASRGF